MPPSGSATMAMSSSSPSASSPVALASRGLDAAAMPSRPNYGGRADERAVVAVQSDARPHGCLEREHQGRSPGRGRRERWVVGCGRVDPHHRVLVLGVVGLQDLGRSSGVGPGGWRGRSYTSRRSSPAGSPDLEHDLLDDRVRGDDDRRTGGVVERLLRQTGRVGQFASTSTTASVNRRADRRRRPGGRRCRARRSRRRRRGSARGPGSRTPAGGGVIERAVAPRIARTMTTTLP